MTRDARYMDVAEVSLLNNALAGVNLEGNQFFYVNPLEADGTTEFNHGQAGRSPWFNTACCPSNIARLMPQVAGMMYSHTDNEIYVSFYAGNSTEAPLKNGRVGIRQESDYPFDGKVRLTIQTEQPQDFQLKLRIPTWAGERQFMPGKLYDYVNAEVTDWSLQVNGAPFRPETVKGFITITRHWKTGDVVELDLPMPVRFNKSIEEVEANRDRVAITRGPLVFAAEGIDNGGPVQQVFLEKLPGADQISQSVMQEGILQNVVKINVPASRVDGEKKEETNLQLIPYYAWNNRGDGSMMVWLPTKREMAEQAIQE